MFKHISILLPLVLQASLWAQQTPTTLAPIQTQIPTHKETVVVTGAFQEVPLDEADRAVTAFDLRNEQLQLRSFVDYFRLEPSLDLRQRAPNGVQGDLSIRGSSFGQTLVLVNGLRVNDAQTGHHNLDLPFPMQSLDRIEILRGAGSTLYGADAVGGAVNFITAPPPVSEFRLGFAAGNFGTNQQTGSGAWVSKTWSQQLSFSRDFSSGFKQDRDYRNLALASETDFKTHLGNTALVLAYGDRPFGADQFYGNFNSWERTKSWFASISQELGKKTQAAFGYRRHTDDFILYRDKPQAFSNNHATESWQGALRRREPVSKNATLFYGAEGYHDSIESTNLGRHSRNRGSGYFAFDMRALNRFSFSIGAREEIYGGMHAQFSPTASAGVWIVRGLKLRAGASRAFRLPTYTDLYYHDPASMGSPDLRPESAWSYEGGLDWNAGGKLATSVTVFHRRENDVIDYMRRTPTDIWRATNIQSLQFTGLEASARIRLPRSQRLDFAYTGLHGAQESLTGLLSRYIFNYPTHSASVSWQGMLPGKVTGRTRLGVTQRFARDPYPLWDMSLSKSFGYLRPYLQFSNLSNTGYQEIPGVAMPGRSVVVGVEMVFRKK